MSETTVGQAGTRVSMMADMLSRLDEGLIVLASIAPGGTAETPWRRQMDGASAAAADGVVVAVRSDGERMRVIFPYELSDFPLDDSWPAGTMALSEMGAIESVCRDRELLCVIRPEDAETLKGLAETPVAILVPSAHITDLPFLERLADVGCPLLLGTGFASLHEVEEAVSTIRRWHGHLVLLHETGRARARPDGINLRVLVTLQERFGCRVGWAMADDQAALAIGAIALGASVIIYPGGLNPEEQRRLVRDARLVRKALGSGEKGVHESDWKLRDSWHRSIVAAVDIPRGTLLTEAMLTTAPPGIGLKPRLLPSLVGKRAAVEIARGTLITFIMVE